jgi:predicted nucleotidyltransferase
VLDLSHEDELRWLARLLADLRRAAPNVEPVLVGALARDVLLHYGHRIAVERRTRDVDFAIAVADWREFSAVREALLGSGLFESPGDAVHRLRHYDLGRVDLIPFGAVERADGNIAWPPTGDEVMSVLGYAESRATAMPVFLPEVQRVLVVSLPMLAVLKLLAWKDRAVERPGADAADLSLILRNYLNAGNQERLYREFPELLTQDFDFEQVGAWLLGHDARDQLQRHSDRFDHVMQTLTGVLDPELNPDGRLAMVSQLNRLEPDAALDLVAAFGRGLLGKDR